MQRPSTSSAVPQNRFERSRRAMRNEFGDSYMTPGANRPGTPGPNVLARPPSTLLQTGTARLATMSSISSGSLNTGLPLPNQMNINIMERPITQHGVASIRPGTCRGLSMTRQIQDKRYYIGLMQLKIRELTQEIAVITKDIEDQNKERATYLHYDKRAKDLATELTALQAQLADYNIVVDKMTSDVGKDIIEQETEELMAKNEQTLLRIESVFEERKQLEEKLSRLEQQLENEKNRTERLIETMDSSTKEKYNDLLKQKAIIQEDVNKMQQELDELSREQAYLEEEIALSPLKQEAVKLHLKIIEAEEKRNKLQEEEKHRISPEEEKENLLQKIKQDNMDIAAAEAQLFEKNKRIQEMEQELEQLETDIEDTQSEKQVKYRELRKREEIMEQFMSSFEQNKEDETNKLHKLEETIVEHLENISSVSDIDVDLISGDEMSILNSIPFDNDGDNNDRSLEGLTKQNLKLQQVLSKMEILEQKLKTEFDDLNERLNKKDNKMTALGNLDNLKAELTIKQDQLKSDCELLNEQHLKYEEELKSVQLEYDEIKERLEHNDIYRDINVLENTLEKLIEEHTNIRDFIIMQKERGNYGPIKADALNLMTSYNTMLKENLKTIY
ncbi:intraflagellar transport protein 74 homolog [Calliopsis andreniformis]|uniref:intraflagellar transport protein 74 homolog n=1 Tax=Calliopsis andreniformis TaxID=337506 RepID=UPI003FCEADDE